MEIIYFLIPLIVIGGPVLIVVLLGYLVFGNFPDSWTWAGAGLIIVSGVYIAIRERRRRRD